MLLQQGAVVVRDEHQPTTNLQARQAGKSLELTGHSHQSRGSEAGLEHLDGAVLLAGGELVHRRRPAFLSIGHAGRSRVLRDSVGDSIDDELLIDYGIEWHIVPFH